MATTLSQNLKLRIDSNLTANAKYNLYRIDDLGGVFYLDASGDVRIRASENIVLQPQDTSVGGTAGGVVTLASAAAPADFIGLYAADTEISGTLSLFDQSVNGVAALAVSYNSTLFGSIDTVNRSLGIDVSGGNRKFILGADLVLTSPSPTAGSLTFNLLGPTELTLPQSGELVTDSATQTLTNKTIDADDNTILNIDVSNFSSNISIPYSKLNLTDSIVNADINSSAAIAYGKLALSNSIKNTDILSNAAISYSKLNLAGSVVNADISGGAAIAYSKLALTSSVMNSDISPLAAISRGKLAAGSPGAVLVNDSSGLITETSVLDTGRGGTSVSSTAVFPTSGLVTTQSNVQFFQNKEIDGNQNTFANVPYSALNLASKIKNSDVSPTAGIQYSKLTLTDSIVDADINSAAAIAGSKIIPHFGAQIISTDDMIQQHGLASGFTLSLQVSPFQTVDYTWTYPTSPGANGQVLTTDGAGALAWSTISGTGTVTSVGFSAPNDVFTVSGAPITTAGTIGLDFVDQIANTVFAGPVTGSDDVPAFRGLVSADLPAGIPATKIGSGAVDNTEFSYLDGVTSAIQTQIDGKQPLDGDLTAIAGLFGMGFNVRTAANTWALRSLGAGTGISISNPDGTAANPTITNTAPDQVVTVAAGAGISVSGTYPGFTVSSTITQYTDVMAQDAVGSILVDSADIDFSYVANTSISAVLTPTLVVAGNYGSASAVATIAVTATGRIDGANSVPIAIASTQVTDFVEAAQDAVGTIFVDSTSIDFTYDDSTPSITAVVSPGTMTSKASPVGADLIVIGDSAASNVVKTASVTSIVALATAKSFKTNWITSDGTTKVIPHNLGTLDVIIQLYDTVIGDTIYVNSAVRTDANAVTLTSSQAPSSSWRVMILAV